MAYLSEAEVVAQVRQELPRRVPWIEEWTFETEPGPGWERADLLSQGVLGGRRQRFLIQGVSQGFPRPVRLAVALLAGLRDAYPDAYPLVAAPYIGPRSAAIC
jgi:hypothetical protein